MNFYERKYFMLQKIRKWRYSKFLRGGAFGCLAILSVIKGGVLNWVIAICLVLISIVCLFGKPDVK